LEIGGGADDDQHTPFSSLRFADHSRLFIHQDPRDYRAFIWTKLK
jgi:hypothetical protein